MTFDSLTQYKVNIMYKHSRNAIESHNTRHVTLAYNTSKFNAPIALLIVFLMLSLVSMTTSPYITRISQLCYVANTTCLFLLPFLTEAILVL